MDNLERAKEELEWTKKQKAENDAWLEQIEIPVDFDQLCAHGLLERTGPTSFKIPNPKRLPAAAAAKLRITVTETIVHGRAATSKTKKAVGTFWTKAN